jgi:hypothetical protein
LIINSKDLIKLLSLALEIDLLDKVAIVKDKVVISFKILILIIYKEAIKFLYKAE